MSGSRARWTLEGQRTQIVVLMLVWLMLSGFSLPNLGFSLVIALLASWMFPLPSVQWGGRLHPIGLAKLVLQTTGQLASASWTLAKASLRPQVQARSSVIKLHLASNTDLYEVVTAVVISIVPGAMVIDARRRTRTLYLHVFDTDAEGLAVEKLQALGQEFAVLEAFGNANERQEAIQELSERARALVAEHPEYAEKLRHFTQARSSRSSEHRTQGGGRR